MANWRLFALPAMDSHLVPASPIMLFVEMNHYRKDHQQKCGCGHAQ